MTATDNPLMDEIWKTCAFKNTTWIRILDFATFSFQHAMSYKKRRESIQNPPQQPLKLFNLSESSNICNVYVCICLYLKAIETSLRMTRTTKNPKPQMCDARTGLICTAQLKHFLRKHLTQNQVQVTNIVHFCVCWYRIINKYEFNI